jgi:hypothetical protein
MLIQVDGTRWSDFRMAKSDAYQPFGVNPTPQQTAARVPSTRAVVPAADAAQSSPTVAARENCEEGEKGALVICFGAYEEKKKGRTPWQREDERLSTALRR